MTYYRPAPHVGVIEHDDVVFVAHLPQGPVIRLDGPAAVIWRAACATDGPASTTVAQRVEPLVDQPLQEIVEGVNTFVSGLIAQGLLEPLPEPGPVR